MGEVSPDRTASLRPGNNDPIPSEGEGVVPDESRMRRERRVGSSGGAGNGPMGAGQVRRSGQRGCVAVRMPGGFCPRAVRSGRRLRAAPPERPPPSPAPQRAWRARGFVHLLLASAPHAALAAQTPDALPPGPARGAYLDETARRLVTGAKAARDTARLGIDSYTALIRERVGVEAPSLRRDRPWMHGERAIRVRWSRTEPDVAHVLGARFRHPGSAPGRSQFFPGLRTERFAADPLADPFVFGSAVFMRPRAADFLTLSPLRPDSERHYRFRSGDTISVRFGDGRAVRAVAVAVIPRYRSVRLVSAIMWIDPESFRLVRVAFRLAKKIDREMSWRWAGGGVGLTVDLGVLDSAEARPDSSLWAAPRTQGLVGGLLSGMLNNSLPRMELDISTVVAEYGLWRCGTGCPGASGGGGTRRRRRA